MAPLLRSGLLLLAVAAAELPSSVELADHLEVFEDPSGRLTLEEILVRPDSVRRREIPKGYHGVNFTRSAIWIRGEVRATPDSGERLVDLRFAKIEHVDFYRPAKEGGWSVEATGYAHPHSSREFGGYHFFLFRLTPDAQGVYRFWMRLESRDQVQFPLFLVTKTRHDQNHGNTMILLGLYFGLLGGLLLYNLFLYTSLRDRAYLWYSAFIFSFGLWMASFGGILDQFFWFFLEIWDPLRQNMHLLIALTNVFALGFMGKYLDLRNRSRPLFLVFRWYPVLLLLTVLLLAPFDYRSSLLLSLGGTVLSVIALLSALVLSIRQGDRSAKYVLYAWAAFMFLGLGSLAATVGWLPYNMFTSSFPYIGSSAQVVLLSFALADRYQILRDQAERSQIELTRSQKEIIQVMEDRLTRDPLTGLPNRNQLIMDLPDRKDAWLFILNLDSFRDVNGFFGVAAGDFILKELGFRLESFAKERGLFIYKFRGDEFGIVADREPDPVAAEEMGRALHSLIADAGVVWREHRIEIDVTIGVGIGKKGLFEKTDRALQLAKEDNKDVVVLAVLDDRGPGYEENLKWARTVREAIRADKVIVQYQPIRNNRTGRVEKVESLMRILDGAGQVVPPGVFLPVARKAKLYGELQRRMIRIVSGEMPLRNDLEFSINVAGEDIRDERTVAYLLEVVEQSPDPTQFVFELLETERIGGDRMVADFCVRVKKAGCKIAVDDFGTGYSNFENLLRLQVDVVKIDGSLIRGIDQEENSRILVQNIVDFSEKLGMRTVAEYVHNAAVQDTVMALGVHYSQGWHVGKPGALPERTN